ncbi:MAG: o-succinylbenzoate synthase [Acidimicrobiia bacterium]
MELAAPEIDAIELWRFPLRMVRPFVTAHGVQHDREILLVRVVAGDDEGWGECGAFAEPTYTADYAASAYHVLQRWLIPATLAQPAFEWPAIKGHQMAKAALQGALLDVALRRDDRSLASLLGGTRQRVVAGVAVGIAPTIDALLLEVAEYVNLGYTRIKLKIEPGYDVEPVRVVRETFGDRLSLQVDANGSYVGRRDELQALDDYGLLFVEQPLGDDDLVGHAALAQHLQTPICLDEAIPSAAIADAALALGACSIVNVKAARVGGYLEAKAVHDVVMARRGTLWCGGMLETGVGRAAALAVASLPGCTLPADLSASDRYWADDITAPFVLRDGGLDVPAGAGIGVTVRRDAVRNAAVETFRRER